MIFGGWEILPPKHGEHFSMDMHGGFFQKVMGDSKDIFPLPPKKNRFFRITFPRKCTPLLLYNVQYSAFLKNSRTPFMH